MSSDGWGITGCCDGGGATVVVAACDEDAGLDAENQGGKMRRINYRVEYLYLSNWIPLDDVEEDLIADAGVGTMLETATGCVDMGTTVTLAGKTLDG